MTLPDEFCNRMLDLIPDEYEDFLRSYETEIYKGIRINTLKCASAADIASRLGLKERVKWCESGYYADSCDINGNHPLHAAGVFYFQEPSAMCASEAMPLISNARILDLCAAPGGKTTHIGARMENKGLLVSNEIIPKRAAILSENVERMGLRNTVVTSETPSRLAEKFPSFFDGIIVDAPCSGEGMFRKEPQAVTEWSVMHTLSCAARQKSILDDAYKMLRPGGYIMYSTCTFSIDENEKVTEYMAEKYGMEICEAKGLTMLSPGIGDFCGIEKCRRIFPHKQRGEGHFAALLRKRSVIEDETAPAEKRDTRRDNSFSGGLKDAIKSYREFECAALNTELSGKFILFGERLYLLEEEIDIDKLKILRCGLLLGSAKKGRFEPSHALSHALNKESFKSFIDLDINSAELKKYMHGEVIGYSGSGWCVVGTDGYGIGWGKASGGTVKNHYPKQLRTLK